MKYFCPKCDERFDANVGPCPQDRTLLLPYDDSDPLVGTQVDGRYEIRKKLGAGGMGSVYLAFQSQIERPVCLKLLHRDMLADTTVVKRFLLEAKAASRLTNPHTITIHDFGTTQEGAPYIAMEYLAGQSLREKLDDVKTMSVADAARVMDQVAESLAEAHEEGIVHRDLKPDNVFLTKRREDDEFVKVLDFGIAQATALAGTKMTRTGMIQGTAAYLSPEVVLGDEADERMDVYALGIMFYEMLAGDAPYTGQTPMQVLMAHVRDEPASIRSVNPKADVPRAIHTFIWRCIAKDQDLRPRNAAAFRQGLAEALEADLTEPEPVKPIITTGKGFRVEAEDLRALQDNEPLRTAVVPAQGGGEAVYDGAPSLVLHTTTGPWPWIIVGLIVVLVASVTTLWIVMNAGGDRGAETSLQSPEPTDGGAKTTPAAGAVLRPRAEVAADVQGKSAEEPALAAPAKAPVLVPQVRVTIISKPLGAQVYLGGERVGTSPWMGRVPKSEASLAVELKLEGYEASRFALVPDQDRLENRSLKKLVPRNKRRARVQQPKAPKKKTVIRPAPAPKAPPAPTGKEAADRVDDWM